eukprot:824139-Alexandrium_andersonii.AAC.1
MSWHPPSDGGIPVTVVTRFVPTPHTAESRALLENLPSDFKEQHAHRLECRPQDLRTLVAFELPDVGLAREYMNFQNNYIQTHGPDSGVPPHAGCPEHMDQSGDDA